MAKRKPNKKLYLAATDGLIDKAADKLASSGLTLEDAEQLGITILSPEMTGSLHQSFESLASLRFDYFDLDGNPQKPQPKWPAIYRLRYLDKPNDFSQVSEAKPRRYTQEPGSGVGVYFPTNTDWSVLRDDPSESLIITEGELKAAKACKEGFPTIGLGGVYNYRSSKMGLSFLPLLEKINWVKRKVYICYDSDFRTNEKICSAINMLADELVERGALPHMVSLPDVTDEGKTGLDDFLVHETHQALIDLLVSSQPLTLAKPLWALNEQVVYINDPGLVLKRATMQKIAPGAFTQHAYAAVNYAERIVKADGSVSLKKTSAAGGWLKWPLRLEAERMTYNPGDGEFVENKTDRAPLYNIWPGWGCQPKKGDVAPFLALVDHLFRHAEPAAKQWFLCWCAYPLQYPGVKLFSSVLMYGIRHGTGKSLIGYTLGMIYGKNFTELGSADLHANFNEWAEAKQFVMGDDVTGSNKRQDNDMLKRMITQKELRVNTKFVPSYVVPDRINYLFTSNHPDAFFLEDDDRRFFIHEVTVGPLEEEFYVEYDLWLHMGGAEAVFYYLQHMDMAAFNPAAPAFRTSAKERMIADVQSDLGAWVRRLMSSADEMLVMGQAKLSHDVFTNKQLLALYDPSGKTGTTANGLGRELRRAGVVQALGGKPVKTTVGQDRYYIIRNLDQWRGASVSAITSHLMTESVTPPKKPKY